MSFASEETPDQVLRRYDPKNRIIAVIAAWMAGELSEGQAVAITTFDAIDLRSCAAEYRAVARALRDRNRETGETISDDMQRAPKQTSYFRCDG